MRPVNTCARAGAASASASRQTARIRRIMPSIISARYGGLFEILFQLRVHSEAALLRRPHFVVRFANAAARHVDHREVVVRLAEPGIHVDRGLPLGLGGFAVAVPEK